MAKTKQQRQRAKLNAANKATNVAKSRSAHPSKLRLWVAGARLRTLPLAVAPVAIGAGVAAGEQAFNLGLSVLALCVALFLQIGVNYANDYSDGIRGTDDHRVGPMRLTGSKAVPAKQVKNASFLFFALAAVAGLVIVLLTQHWWFLAVGAAAIVAAWFYTGGKRPYGYAGLGEVVVFVFFGPVAVYGTTFIQTNAFSGNALMGGIAAGSWAAAVLMVNNLRDLKQDVLAGKRTLAVRVGARAAKAIYALLVLVPFAIWLPFVVLYPATWAAGLIGLLALTLIAIVSTARSVPEWLLALKLTSYGALAYALLLGWGLFRVSSLL